MSETKPITAQRLLDHAASDHLRGCMGRQYSCTCEYDTITERLLVDAASRIQELEPKAAAYDACSSKIDCLSRGAVPVRDDGAERMAGLSFGAALDLAQEGLDRWREKPHNAKWWRRIDGTPIPNDLLVNIAEVIATAIQPKDTAK